MTDQTWTIGAVLKWTAGRFAKEGIDSSRLDAEVLLAHVLGVERLNLYLDYDKPLAAGELAAFRDLVRRRLTREPVAYLIGQREFWSLSFKVTPATLCPRPESELLVESVLALVSIDAPVIDAPVIDSPVIVDPVIDSPVIVDPVIADVGTGCGAIAVALAKALPTARVLAIDSFDAALAVAQENAERHEVAVEFFAGDLLDALPRDLQIDVCVANLPYVPSAEIPQLMPEVRDFEPVEALDGGPDGLAVFERLIPQARKRMNSGGALVLEIGEGQGGAVSKLLESEGFERVQLRKDLAGVQRVVSGTKKR